MSRAGDSGYTRLEGDCRDGGCKYGSQQQETRDEANQTFWKIEKIRGGRNLHEFCFQEVDK